MQQIEVNGITFEFFEWGFQRDGDLGVISFLVPSGSYIYNTSNGVSSSNYIHKEGYDIVDVSCECFRIDGRTAHEFLKFSLGRIMYSAANYADECLTKKLSKDDEFTIEDLAGLFDR